jgi:5-methylcytosine-specific restriction endonuclease McrA
MAPRIGHIVTEETRRKISAKHTGKKLSDDHRRKLSLAKLGKPSHRKGKSHTEEAKTKMRGRKMSDENKRKVSERTLGTKASEETRKKLSESLKLAYKNGNRKKITYTEELRKVMSDNAKGFNSVGKWMSGRTGKSHPGWKHGSGPEMRAYWCNQRRIRKFGNGGSHTLEDWTKLKERYNLLCAFCLKGEPEVKLTKDHIIPVCKGGRDDISNIQPLCKSCNSKKHRRVEKYTEPRYLIMEINKLADTIGLKSEPIRENETSNSIFAKKINEIIRKQK